MRKPVLFLLMLLLLAVGPAWAEKGQKGDWEIGPYGGIGYLDDFGGLNPDDGWLYGARFGYFLTNAWSLEGSLQRLDSKTDADSSLGVSDFDLAIKSFRLNVLYNFMPGKTLRPFATAGAGREKIDTDSGGDSDIGYNLGGGIRWYLGQYFGVRLDGRYVSLDVEDLDQRQGNLEATVGLLWSFGGAAAAAPADGDGDGVADKKDKCPDTPAGARVDERGCPIDTDGDGVADGIDACPQTPSGQKVDATGCPPDTDKDGVIDEKDACPDTPQGAPVDERGCPRDTDGDGVPDHQDRCPNTPAGSAVDAVGCPPPPPPPEPPKAAPLFTAEKKALVLEGVTFATNNAQLTGDSSAMLNQVAESLRDWPDVRVEIGGHTDSQASDAYNQKLSQARAEAVKTYLVGQGIAADRLTAKGYGEKKPIADNKTADGRARNRRVELTRLD